MGKLGIAQRSSGPHMDLGCRVLTQLELRGLRNLPARAFLVVACRPAPGALPRPPTRAPPATSRRSWTLRWLCQGGSVLISWAPELGSLSQWLEDRAQGRLARLWPSWGQLVALALLQLPGERTAWRWPHTTPAAESAAGTPALSRRLRPTSKASSGHRTQSPSQQGQGAEWTH